MNKNMSSTRKLVILGVMLAVTIISVYTVLIPVGSVSATISHIPTIVVGIILGPVYGLIMGASFGLVTLFRALTSPLSPLDPLFINPLISVLPRMLIGVTSYYAYVGVRHIFGKKTVGQTVSSAVAGVIGSLTNTVFVLGMLYIVYAQEIMKRIELADKAAVKTVIWGVVTTNGIIEAIIAGIITTAIVSAYYVVYRNEINTPAAK